MDVATVTWALVGYSLAFDGTGDFIGGFGNAFLNDVDFEPRPGTTIPHLVFFAFQATHHDRARLGRRRRANALWRISRVRGRVVGARVRRARPLGVRRRVARAAGTLDFAGGIPVEMGSGFSALAAALVVGARKDYGRQAILPHNTVYVLMGAGLLCRLVRLQRRQRLLDR